MTDSITQEDRDQFARLPSYVRARLERELAETAGVVKQQKAALQQLREQLATREVALAELPVSTLAEALPHLRRPFTPAAVKFKVQAATPKAEPTNALIVCYIDARLVVERLNLVIPAEWSDLDYAPAGGGAGLLCRLSVGGVTRQDVGSGYKGKGLYSDAFKRAAVKFGVGVSLYATPKMWLRLAGEPADVKRANTQNGPTLVLTESGEQRCRATYGAWLERTGIAAFGEPLDHGDVLDAAGDAELEAEAVASHSEAEGSQEPRPQRRAAPPPQPQPQPPQSKPAEPGYDEQLARLLGDPESVVGRKQREAVAGMDTLGAKAEQQFRELNAAGADESALDQLLARVNAAVDQTAADAGPSGGE